MTLQRVARAVLVAALAMACDRGAPSGGSGAAAEEPSGITGEVLVSAAASLTDAFRQMESVFEAAHPGVDVILNLGGSSGLRTQILEGAPADLFASADEKNMGHVVAAGAVSGEPMIFARNRLQIAVPAGNPGGIDGLDDFTDNALRLGLCAEGVPCGNFGREILARAGVAPALDTNEPDVRALLTKIELGELDGGITYASDVASADGAVEGIEIPDELNVEAGYHIAVLGEALNPAVAEAFVRFVLAEEGRSILADHGFALP